MKCPNCGVDNPPQNKFCGGCGHGLLSAVADRISIVRRDIPQSLARDSAVRERKDVTVVFADISGFTTMAEALDPEELSRIANECFRRLSMMVYRYEGIVDKFIGDCIMAIFGAPVAHEDDPERAILACLDMQFALDEMNTRYVAGTRVLQIHSGINSGEVVAGKVGSDLQMEYTVMGDTVNVAQRLKDVAAPGTILVGPETYNRARHAFDFIPQETVGLKGKTEHIKPYEVVGKKWGAEFGLGAVHSDLIGRDIEFGRLKDGYQRLLEGHGSITLIKGEIGVGKSRLLYELKKFLTMKSTEVALFEDRGFSYESVIPYKCFIDCLRRYFLADQPRMVEHAEPAMVTMLDLILGKEADDVTPYLYRILNIPMNAEQRKKVDFLEGDALQLQTFLAIATLFERVAAKSPVIIIFDDIQWADPVSLGLVSFLLPMTKSKRLSFYLSYRLGDLTAIRGFLASLRREHGEALTEVELGSLGESDSARLLDNLVGKEVVPVLKKHIIDKSGGNPFFLVEIAKSLAESGRLVSDAPILPEEIEIPGSIDAAVSSRIDGLGKEAKYLLKVAAVIGRYFPRRLLEEVVKEPDVIAHLEELETAEFLVRINKNNVICYTFQHPIFQEVAYRSLLKSERLIYHRLIAEKIESSFNDLEGYLATLAHHYSCCQENEKAIEYALKAGAAAAELYANEEALANYQLALAVADSPARRAMVLEKIGDLVLFIGTVDRAVDSYEKAKELFADRLGRARVQAKIGRIMTNTARVDQGIELMRQAYKDVADTHGKDLVDICYILADRVLEIKMEYAEADRLTDKAIEVSRELGDEKLQADGLRMKGQVLWRQGQYEKAMDLIKEALPLYERQKAKNSMVSLFILMAAVSRAMGNLSQAVSYVQRAIGLATEIGDKKSLTHAYNNLGIYYDRMGDLTSALAHYEKSCALRMQIGDERGMGIGYYNIGIVRTKLGERDAGLECYHKAREIMEKANDVRGLVRIHISIGTHLIDDGKAAQSLEYFERALAVANDTNDRLLMSVALSGYADYYAAIGDPKAAIESLNRAMALVVAQDREQLYAVHAKLAELLIESRDAAGLTHAECAFRAAGESKAIQNEIGGLRNLGRAQAIFNRNFADAYRNIKRAIAMAQEHRFADEEAECLLALGEVAGEDGKTAAALEHLEKGRRMFCELKMPYGEQRAARLIEKLSKR